MTAPRLFLDCFRAVVNQHGDRPAVCQAGLPALTYAELDQQARALATHLRARGTQRESVVGLCLEKSADHIVALLGTWYAGAAFVPLDPQLPRQRLAFMVRDAGLNLVVTTPEKPGLFDGLNVDFLLLGRTALLSRMDGSGEPSYPTVQEEDLAYLIYTSGTTGQPKGVIVPHRGIVNLLQAQIEAFQLCPSSRSLFYLSTNFDASISDIGTVLLAGATLYIEPPANLQPGPGLAQLLSDRGITHVDLPPALLRVLDPATMPASLKTIIIGGEVCPPDVVRAWARKFCVINVYGPTEATVCTSLCVCDAETWEQPLLGRPLPNVSLQVLDAQLEPVAPGTPGELHIGGIGLACGYRNLPELTARKFIVRGGERLYRTGDRVVLRPDGEIVFLGRLDRQVKVRGQLVELEEIEARLLEHPQIQQAAVVKRSLAGEREGLIAFLVVKKDDQAPAPGDVSDFLALMLASWMVPQRFEFLPELPQTVTGKIDLAALTTWPLQTGSSLAETPPDWSQEARLLAEIWQRTLGVATVGWTDDFWDLGGDSLALVEAVAAAEARGLLLPPEWLAQRYTLGEIVARLRPQEDSLLGTTPPGAISCDVLRHEADLGPAWADLLQRARARPPLPELDQPPRSILLTGGTGFLGSYLLPELLRRTEAEVYCLVRAANSAEARERLAAAFRPLGQTLSPEQTRRIIPLVGDLEKPLLGLSPSEWHHLTEVIDAVYHGAARVNLVLPYRVLRPGNVLGTCEVLRFLCEGRRKRLHYASTLSVFVATDRNTGVLQEADELEQTRWVYGGYAQTKWASEWLLRAHRAAAGPITYFRLGLLTGDTQTGRSSAGDLLTLFVQGLARLGCVPRDRSPKLALDVTPVDYAAAALAHLSQRAPEQEMYHIANPRSLSLNELIEAMRSFGIPLEEVSSAAWRRRLADFQAVSEVCAAYLALCRCLDDGAEAFSRLRTLDLFQATGVVFDTRNTQAGLAGSGLECPPPTQALLHRYFRRIFSPGSATNG